jgi:hypothetical protein
MRACSLQVILHRDGVRPTISCGQRSLRQSFIPDILTLSVHFALSFSPTATLMQTAGICTAHAGHLLRQHIFALKHKYSNNPSKYGFDIQISREEYNTNSH